MVSGSGLKKYFKRDPIKVSVLRTPPKLQGGIFIYGRIGSGKTVSMLSLANNYHDNPMRRYKIFDLWGGSRNEHLYWGLPSNQHKYWSWAKKKLRLSESGEKQYKVEYLYPLTPKLRRKLPFNPPNVSSKVFTIPIRELTAREFSLVVGSLPEGGVGAWRNILDDTKRKDSAIYLAERYRKVAPKNNIYTSVIRPLTNNHLLQDYDCPFNMTRKEISRMLDDQETVTVLCLDFVEEEYKLLILGFLIRMITEELDRRRRPTIGLIREASEFFKVADQSVAPERMKVMKSFLSDWIRMGRRGLHLFLDTQSPNETKGIVEGQSDLQFFGRLTGENDRRVATEQLYRDGLITKSQINKLGVSSVGQFLVSPSGKPAYFVYVMLPRCRYWEERNGNFYTNIWEKEIGRWTEYKEEIDKIKAKFKEDQKEAEERILSLSKRKKPSKSSKEIVKKNEVVKEEHQEMNSPSTPDVEKDKKEPEKPKANFLGEFE